MSSSVVDWRGAAFTATLGLLGLANAAAAGLTTATVAVEILPSADRSVAGAVVELQAKDDPILRRSRVIGDLPSRATFALVPPGTYRLTVSLAGFSDATLDVRVQPGTLVTVRAELRPAGTASALYAIASVRTSDAVVFDEPLLQALPSGRSPWSLIETADARAIVDRIDDGGLWTGEAPLVGVHGNSWRQASMQVGALDLTDPARTGRMLIQPDPAAMSALFVSAGSLPADENGPGPASTLVPRRPGADWRGTVRVATSPAAWQANNARAGAPPIARLDSLTDGSVLASGPLAARGPRLLVAGRVIASDRLERHDPTVLRSDLRSLFTHLVLPRPDGDVRLVATGEWSTHPYNGRMRFRDPGVTEDDASAAVQGSWSRARADAVAWSVTGAYQRATLDPAIDSSAGDDPTDRAGTVERLRDGPVLALFDTMPGTRQRWALQADAQRDLGPARGRLHALRAGVSVAHNVATAQPSPAALVAETVGGIPARLWSYGTLGAESRWSSIEIGGYVADRVPLASSLTVDAGVRLDASRGSARGGPASVFWLSVSPRVNARWTMHGGERTAVFGGYARYAHRLPLDYLAYGDRAAAAGSTYRWNDLNGDRLLQAGEQGAMIAAVGPCCAGAIPNSIDPRLRPPRSDEFVVGIEHRVVGNLRLRLIGTDRRDRRLVASVNTGVGLADYTVSMIPDQGTNWFGTADDRLLPVYDRRRASFGQDRYVLTNPPGHDARYQGLDLALEQGFGSRGQMLFGGAAYRAEGIGANRGFRATENDQGIVGEAFENPNAATYARGRLFFDRAFVIKWSTTYLAGRETTLGVIARYQDGQPFARVVIVPDLQQGAEIVQAYARGRTRFTFTLTVDAKVEKAFALGRRRVAGSLEAFNLLNTANEVEEDPVTGPTFRVSTAVQPPRVVRLGVRVEF